MHVYESMVKIVLILEVLCFGHVFSSLFLEKSKSVFKQVPSDVKAIVLNAIKANSSDKIMLGEYVSDLKMDPDSGRFGYQTSDGQFKTANTVRSYSSKVLPNNKEYHVYRFKVRSSLQSDEVLKVELRFSGSTMPVKQKTKVKYVIKQNRKVILKYRKLAKLRPDGKYVVLDLPDVVKNVMNVHDVRHGKLTIKVSLKKSKTMKNSSNHTTQNTIHGNQTANDALLIIFSNAKERLFGGLFKLFHPKDISKKINLTF